MKFNQIENLLVKKFRGEILKLKYQFEFDHVFFVTSTIFLLDSGVCLPFNKELI